MKRFYSRLGIGIAALALVSAPAVAGQRPHDSSTPASDHAVDRGSAGSSSAGGSQSSGGGSAVSGGSVESTSTAPSAVASSPTFGGADRRAPMYAEPQRRGGGGNSGGSSASGGSQRGGGSSSSGGERAVPRGSSGSGSSGTSKSGNDGTTSSSSSSGSGNRRAAPARDNGEVPSWSRPRGDRPATDTATQRTGPVPDRNHGGGSYGRYYDPFYPYGYGYGFYGNYYYPGGGLGYGYGLPLFYDPWYDPYGGYGYAGGGGYYSGTQYASVDQGKVRLKVKPRNAKVYVDGYFVGDVDQFDGMFQKLTLNGGRHHVEIKADGYETAEFDVMIMPDQTVTYEGELKRIQ